MKPLPKTPAELRKAATWQKSLHAFKMEQAAFQQEHVLARQLWKDTERSIRTQDLQVRQQELKLKRSWQSAERLHKKKTDLQTQTNLRELTHLRNMEAVARLQRAQQLGQARKQMKLDELYSIAAAKAELRDARKKNSTGGGSGGGKGYQAFGGFAFGPRAGIISALGDMGTPGIALGSMGLVAEATLSVFRDIAQVFTVIGASAAYVTTELVSWGADLISFNQQAQIGIDALTNGSAALSHDYGDYLRRTLARYTPFTTEQTLTMTPMFQSMMSGPDAFRRANYDTQLVSDIGYGLNPGRTTQAVHLSSKLLSDVMAKGYLVGEELNRQAPNLGLPANLVKTAIRNIWNSDDFQKLNPTAGKLQDTAAVEEAIRDRKVGSNLAIAAFSEVVKYRLQRDTIGEYSKWATQNTIGGLMSQLSSFPTEIAASIAESGTSTGGIMQLLRGTTHTLGDAQAQDRMAGLADQAFTNFLGFGQGAIAALGQENVLASITGGINAIDWEGFGQTFGKAMGWLANAFEGTMIAVGQLQPVWTKFADDFMTAFDKEFITQTVTGVGLLALALAKLGTAVLGILSPVTTFLGISSVGLGMMSGDTAFDDAPANRWLRNGVTDADRAAMDAVRHLKQPLQSNTQDVQKIGESWGEAFPRGFNEGAEIRSPSKRMQRSAEYLLEPLHVGLEEVQHAGFKLGEKLSGSVARQHTTNATGGQTYAPVFNIYPSAGMDERALANQIYTVMLDDLRSSR